MVKYLQDAGITIYAWFEGVFCNWLLDKQDLMLRLILDEWNIRLMLHFHKIVANAL